MALREGTRNQALKFMCAAGDGEDGSVKNVSTKNRAHPLRELLADLLLEIGQSADALRECEAALKAYSNRYRRAADAVGNRAEADEHYGKLVKELTMLTPNGEKAGRPRAFWSGTKNSVWHHEYRRTKIFFVHHISGMGTEN